jgi:hypothetical protein
LVAFVLGDLVVVACVAYDTFKNRRLHPAFVLGGLWIIFSLPLRLAIAHAAPWHAFVNWSFQFANHDAVSVAMLSLSLLMPLCSVHIAGVESRGR